MTLEFSPQQNAALAAIEKWFSDESARPFVLNGFAGTGKTTIAKYMPEVIKAKKDEEVLYVAYTGKAASQLERKGCRGATTAHRLLYVPIAKSKKNLINLNETLESAVITDPNLNSEESRKLLAEIKKERLRLSSMEFTDNPDEERLRHARLIIVDESSMIDQKIHQDLMALKKPVIYCGDPFQLPPVRGASPVSQLAVDVMLTEVHRQALDNPILALATDLRNRKPFSTEELEHRNGDQLLQIKKMSSGSYMLYNEHDQILCAMNATRNSLNQKIRKRKIEENIVWEGDDGVGRGDRIIFLRNDYDNNYFNGTMGVVDRVRPARRHQEYMISIDGETDEDNFRKYDVWTGFLHGRHKSDQPNFTQSIDLAYAITCHKSQGSEWDSVLVHFERMSNVDIARWLYTAITRAKKRCTIMVPGR